MIALPADKVKSRRFRTPIVGRVTLLRGLPIDLLADYGQRGSKLNVRFATFPGAQDHCAGARKPRVAHRICPSVTSFVIFSGPRITVTITFSPSE